jgi:hypothetical protein
MIGEYDPLMDKCSDNPLRVVNNFWSTELLGLFWILSIVLYVEDKTMDKIQNKPNSSVQHTPSSESFQVNFWSDYLVRKRPPFLDSKTSACLQKPTIISCS